MPKKYELQQNLFNAGFGVLSTPYSLKKRPSSKWIWAADNGCFSNRWQYEVWQRWLKSNDQPETALFATVPDVVCDHRATVYKWACHWEEVKTLGYKTAFVLQDNATIKTMPISQMDALFIGGSTDYKLSDDAYQIVKHCKSLGKWVHMGRVNSKKRMQIAYQWGCDSVDGTYLAFAPDANTPRLIRHMNAGTQPQLF
jgi:hypothetical protein